MDPQSLMFLAHDNFLLHLAGAAHPSQVAKGSVPAGTFRLFADVF